MHFPSPSINCCLVHLTSYRKIEQLFNQVDWKNFFTFNFFTSHADVMNETWFQLCSIQLHLWFIAICQTLINGPDKILFSFHWIPSVLLQCARRWVFGSGKMFFLTYRMFIQLERKPKNIPREKVPSHAARHSKAWTSGLFHAIIINFIVGWECETRLDGGCNVFWRLFLLAIGYNVQCRSSSVLSLAMFMFRIATWLRNRVDSKANKHKPHSKETIKMRF